MLLPALGYSAVLVNFKAGYSISGTKTFYTEFGLNTAAPTVTVGNPAEYVAGPDLYVANNRPGSVGGTWGIASFGTGGLRTRLNNSTHIDDCLFLFKTDSVRFDAQNDTLQAVNIFCSKINSLEVAQVRFVIEAAGVFYISESSINFAATTLTGSQVFSSEIDALEATWYAYDPTTSEGVSVIGAVASPTFQDIGFVGFTLLTNASATNTGVNFGVREFSATGAGRLQPPLYPFPQADGSTTGNINALAGIVGCMMAYPQWGDESYRDEARAILDDFYDLYVVDTGRLDPDGVERKVIKPGAFWGYSDDGQVMADMAFASPAYLRALDFLEGGTRWSKPRNSIYWMIDNLRTRSENQYGSGVSTGLLPNFMGLDGQLLLRNGGSEYLDEIDSGGARYKYALDYLWFGSDAARIHLSAYSDWWLNQHPTGNYSSSDPQNSYLIYGTVETSGGSVTRAGGLGMAAMVAGGLPEYQSTGSMGNRSRLRSGKSLRRGSRRRWRRHAELAGGTPGAGSP